MLEKKAPQDERWFTLSLASCQLMSCNSPGVQISPVHSFHCPLCIKKNKLLFCTACHLSDLNLAIPFSWTIQNSLWFVPHLHSTTDPSSTLMRSFFSFISCVIWFSSFLISPPPPPHHHHHVIYLKLHFTLHRPKACSYCSMCFVYSKLA